MKVQLTKSQEAMMRNKLRILGPDGDFYHNPFWYKNNHDGTFTELREKAVPIAVLDFKENKYKDAYNILMEYFDNISDEEKPIVHEQLKKLGL